MAVGVHRGGAEQTGLNIREPLVDLNAVTFGSLVAEAQERNVVGIIRAGRQDKIDPRAYRRGEIKFGGEGDRLGLAEVQECAAAGVGWVREDANGRVSGAYSAQGGRGATHGLVGDANAYLPIAWPACGGAFDGDSEGTGGNAAAGVGDRAGHDGGAEWKDAARWRRANDGAVETGGFDFVNTDGVCGASHDYLVGWTFDRWVAAGSVGLDGHITDPAIGLTLTNVDDGNIGARREWSAGRAALVDGDRTGRRAVSDDGDVIGQIGHQWGTTSDVDRTGRVRTSDDHMRNFWQNSDSEMAGGNGRPDRIDHRAGNYVSAKREIRAARR